MGALNARLIVTVLAASLLAAPVASASTVGHAAPTAKPTVSAPSEVTEGDVFTITVKVPRGARVVLLQHQETDLYGNTRWEIVKRSRKAGKLSYHGTAGEQDTEAFRARVLFSGHRASMSKTSRTTVWHWTALEHLAGYLGAPGATTVLTFAMNGTQYADGWAAYAGYPSFQAGWTLGRHCKALRADAGVTDQSTPGSSAALQFVTDDGATVFASGPLTPGMVQPVNVALATPYRLEVHAQDTSPDKVQAYPALGDPELLCTGLD